MSTEEKKSAIKLLRKNEVPIAEMKFHKLKKRRNFLWAELVL